MNKIFRLIWSKAKEKWVVVAEKVSSKGCCPAATVGALTLAALLASGSSASALDLGALPTGGRVTAGQGTISQTGNAMTVNQNTPRMNVDWSSFNIGQNASVRYNQPGASSIALNRIQGQSPSQILGSLSANGQVWLVNPSGILFGSSATVDVGGLVASSLNISSDNFMAGKNIFEKTGSAGTVTNQGTIRTADGGYVAFIAPRVINEGSIITPKGTTALAAGDKVSLDFTGDSLVTFTVDQGAVDALADNKGLIKADGGLVMMTAQAADALTTAVVNNSGIIEAQTLENRGGRILLVADMEHGETIVSGRLDASAPNGGDGGFIETSAAKVTVKEDATISTLSATGTTGQWLIDPVDITIAAAGGNVTGATIATALRITNVTLDTNVSNPTDPCTGVSCGSPANSNGDITVNDNITVTGGSANTTLTLKANRSIIMNSGKSIDASGNGTNKVNVVFNADSDATGGGYIWLKGTGSTGATIKTNGGNLTLSGGTDVTTGYAQGNATVSTGIVIDSATLNTNGGNIFIRGKSHTAASAAYTLSFGSTANANGILMSGSNTIDSGTGTIDIQGVAQATGAVSNAIETNFIGYSKILSAATNTTAINLSGDATAGANGNGWGTFLWGTNTSGIVLAATGANGGITLNGKGRNYTNGGGTHLEPNAFVLAASGPISITGTKGAASTYEDVVINSTVGYIATLPVGFGIASPVTASTSNITIASDTMSANRIFGGGSLTGSAVQSSGTLTLQPRTAGNALSIQTTAPASGSWINPNSMFGASGLFKTGFSKLIFGSATTGNVTLDNYTFDNDTDLLTGGNAVLGAVSIGSKTLTVDVTGSGTITDTGAVAVSKLKLNGASSAATLDTATNAIGTIAANVASLSLLNNSALTIGTAGGTNGITATGLIDIATKSGDLTVSKNVSTGNTSATAIKLNAGKDAAAGTSTGGNIIISGNPAITTGAGGFTTLYSGSITNSTGLAAKTTSGHFRYNSDEAATNFTTPLTAAINVIYREQPTITTTANAGSKTYDGLTYSGGNGVTYGGFVNGDTSAILGGTLVYGGTSKGAKNAGTYTIAPSGYTNGLGYGLVYSNGILTVNKAHLTVTADNQSRTYGTANPIFTETVTGFVNGENATTAGITGTATGSSVATTTTGVGTSTITASAGTLNSANYDFSTLVNGSLTINKAHLTVTADNQSRTYGAANPTFTETVTGFVNGENATSAGITGTATGSSAATATTGVGTSTITASAGTLNAANYDFPTLVNGSLTINKAHLTVTADNQSRIYGAANPTFTETVTGFVNGENATTAGLTGSATGSSAATATTGVGTAVITASAGNLNAANYDFTPANGTLTITKAHLTVTADNQSRTYGAANPTFTETVTGFVNGENATTAGITGTATGSSNATATTVVGTSTIAASAGSLSAVNYDFPTLVNGTLTINKAHLTVTADNQGRLYGRPDPIFTETITGFVNGENATTAGITGTATGSSTATATTGVGTSTIAASAGTLAAANYDFPTLANGTLTIDKAPLNVMAINDTITEGFAYSGGNGVTYIGFLNGENSSVLGGTLGYDGTSQGAYIPGSYSIIPKGLTSNNYTLGFFPGILRINTNSRFDSGILSLLSVPDVVPPVESQSGSGNVGKPGAETFVGSPDNDTFWKIPFLDGYLDEGGFGTKPQEKEKLPQNTIRGFEANPFPLGTMPTTPFVFNSSDYAVVNTQAGVISYPKDLSNLKIDSTTGAISLSVGGAITTGFPTVVSQLNLEGPGSGTISIGSVNNGGIITNNSNANVAINTINGNVTFGGTGTGTISIGTVPNGGVITKNCNSDIVVSTAQGTITIGGINDAVIDLGTGNTTIPSKPPTVGTVTVNDAFNGAVIVNTGSSSITIGVATGTISLAGTGTGPVTIGSFQSAGDTPTITNNGIAPVSIIQAPAGLQILGSGSNNVTVGATPTTGASLAGGLGNVNAGSFSGPVAPSVANFGVVGNVQSSPAPVDTAYNDFDANRPAYPAPQTVQMYENMLKMQQAGQSSAGASNAAMIEAMMQNPAVMSNPQYKAMIDNYLATKNSQTRVQPTTDQLRAMTAAQIKNLTEAQLVYMTPEQVNILTSNKEQLAALSPGQLITLAKYHSSAFSAQHLTSLGDNLLQVIYSGAGFSAEVLKSIPPEYMSKVPMDRFEPKALLALTPAQLTNIPGSQFNYFVPEVLAQMSTEQVQALNLGAISISQLTFMGTNKEFVRKLSPAQVTLLLIIAKNSGTFKDLILSNLNGL